MHISKINVFTGVFHRAAGDLYDKKLLTIINTIELLKSELENIENPLQETTDHTKLEYFKSNKLLNRRPTRWSKFLFEFNFEIIYRPGSMNNKTELEKKIKSNN